MSRDWAVRIEAFHRADQEKSLRVIDHIMRTLHQYAAVGSAGPTSLEVQMTVTADSLESAFVKSLKAFNTAVRKAGMPHGFHISDVEIETPERFEMRLNEPDFELVGVAELASMLGVSRARASAIAARRDFPAPYTRLAAGPVWIKAHLGRWFEDWKRSAVVRERQMASHARVSATPATGLAARAPE